MNLEQARHQMVEQQVRAWDVLDERVLETLTQVRRELFTPSTYRELAFADTTIPLAGGQWMLAPKVDGRILQALEVELGHEILEIGTGSGFLAACLVRLGGRVRSLEISPELSTQATENLRAAGVSGVSIETRDALSVSNNPALSEPERYDAIALTGSLPIYDTRFEQALKVGGRLFVIVGEAPAMQALLVRRESKVQWRRETLFETVVAPLINAPLPSQFVF